MVSDKARRVRVAAPLLLACAAGCTNGLSGSPSIATSPAAAVDLARQKALDESQRESLGAQCFDAAVAPGMVTRIGLAEAPGEARIATPLPSLSLDQARQMLMAEPALVPVYCRNAEPSGVRPAKTAEAKLRDAAAWYRARGLAVATTSVAATVRSYGNAQFFETMGTYDTGQRREVMITRSGAVTDNPNKRVRSVSAPIYASDVALVDTADVVDVPGQYTEAWLLVVLPKDKARAYRSACAAAVAGRGEARAAPAPLEAQRACSLYTDTVTAAIERPAVVPLNPRETLR